MLVYARPCEQARYRPCANDKLLIVVRVAAGYSAPPSGRHMHCDLQPCRKGQEETCLMHMRAISFTCRVHKGNIWLVSQGLAMSLKCAATWHRATLLSFQFENVMCYSYETAIRQSMAKLGRTANPRMCYEKVKPTPAFILDSSLPTPTRIDSPLILFFTFVI